jgi:hypothetical protein
MGNKLTPKIILEGTRLTFKTEIAFELNEHPRIVGQRKDLSKNNLNTHDKLVLRTNRDKDDDKEKQTKAT